MTCKSCQSDDLGEAFTKKSDKTGKPYTARKCNQCGNLNFINKPKQGGKPQNSGGNVDAVHMTNSLLTQILGILRRNDKNAPPEPEEQYGPTPENDITF